MPRTTLRAPLILTDKERKRLESLATSRKPLAREIQRAKILLAYSNQVPIQNIARDVGVNRQTVYKCIDKALAMGCEAGLSDLYHRPHDPVITPDAKAWVVSLACTSPKDLGMAAELWTRSALANYVRTHASATGHPSLQKAVKATVHRILEAQTLKPHKITYYLEKKDPEFDRKMREVLMVYREVTLVEQRTADGRPIITVSVDEKPGVQALATVAPDLPPVPGKHPTVSRDYEYKRLGTLSILASLDLQDGHVIAKVHERHRSREFVDLLKEIDAYYPSDATIRVILDNHSAHISKETRAYLATRPNRFIYVHTPKHVSWLNLVETLFSKMSRTFLKQIRVASLDELKDRIQKGVMEINASPVIHQWRNLDFESESA
ncbi:MAG: IS630 family transposase [Leptospirillum sp.]